MGHRPCWNCRQPATHTLTRDGSNTLDACDNCTRIDREQAEKTGWTITPTGTAHQTTHTRTSRKESPMTEYGVFEDGACIEAGFHGETGKADAEAHMADLIAADPDMASAYEVAEICPDHEEQSKNGCEECAEDADETEEDEDC